MKCLSVRVPFLGNGVRRRPGCPVMPCELRQYRDGMDAATVDGTGSMMSAHAASTPWVSTGFCWSVPVPDGVDGVGRGCGGR